MPKLVYFEKFELNISSCRVFCGLSENHNIIEIEQSELKLWLFNCLSNSIEFKQYLMIID